MSGIYILALRPYKNVLLNRILNMYYNVSSSVDQMWLIRACHNPSVEVLQYCVHRLIFLND